MSSCGCNGGQSTPPDSTPKATSLPAGTGSSYGGSTRFPNACTPNVCPQPPVNDEVGKEPYCPDWVSKVLKRARGRLAILTATCIYRLASKCTGVVWYDAETEEVSVKDAPFVPSNPQQTRYGFLAKVVTKAKKICDDNAEECVTEARQELAAQLMEQTNAGQLVIAVPPLCGELPQDQAADSDKQVAFHYLDPKEASDCSPFSFLTMVMGKRGKGNSQVDVPIWRYLKKLKFRRSQIGQAISGSADEASSFIIVAVPVPGGDSNDPCYEFRISEVKPGSGVPSVAENCDTLVFKNKGLATAGWYAQPKGLAHYPLNAPSALLFSTHAGGTADFGITLPEFPTQACGKIMARFEVVMQAFAGASNSATNISASMNGWPLGSVGFYGSRYKTFAEVPVTSAANVVNFLKAGTGASNFEMRLLGYSY